MSIQQLDELKSFNAAICVGLENLSSLDPSIVAENAMAEYNKDHGTFSVSVLGKKFTLDPQKRILYYPYEMDDHVMGSMAVLILHYLANSRPGPFRNRLISYRELPNGMVFYGAFRNIAIEPIAQTFGDDISAFEKRAVALGGRKVDHGEMGFEFQFFPRLAVTIVMWAGDDEIPGSANILYDASAPDQMHTEDLAEIGEVITHLLVHSG